MIRQLSVDWGYDLQDRITIKIVEKIEDKYNIPELLQTFKYQEALEILDTLSLKYGITTCIEFETDTKEKRIYKS